MRLKINKYNAKRVERNGFKFDSKKEAEYYDKLCILKERGEIIFFLRQVPFHIDGNVKYIVDFMILWKEMYLTFVDVKGFETKEFKIKKKVVEATYGVEIEMHK